MPITKSGSDMHRAEPVMERQVAATILIVEDHPTVLRAVRALLSAAFPACRVLAAESGEQALDLCASDVPCVVVMDVGLPGIDGIEATRRIKARLPDTAVVMHSGNDKAVFRDAAAAAGASAFVSKNKTFSELVPAISGLLAAVLRAPAGGPIARAPGTPPHVCTEFPTDTPPALFYSKLYEQ